MFPVIALTSSPESVPDWLVILAVVALAAILMARWVRSEINKEN